MKIFIVFTANRWNGFALKRLQNRLESLLINSAFVLTLLFFAGEKEQKIDRIKPKGDGIESQNVLTESTCNKENKRRNSGSFYIFRQLVKTDWKFLLLILYKFLA